MSEFKSWEEMSPLEQMACSYSDFFKSAYGFRPRSDVSSWTVEDFQKEFDVLEKVCEENEAIRIKDQLESAASVEKRIADLINSGANDRATAIRWISDFEGADGDMEYLCFLVGVDYGYFK